jgi:hypothetical protein
MSTDEIKAASKINFPFYISRPFTFYQFANYRGAEYVHSYLWILKDLSWMQGYHYPSILFGLLALIWCGVLAVPFVITANIEELYMLTGTALWLFGLFVLLSLILTQLCS